MGAPGVAVCSIHAPDPLAGRGRAGSGARLAGRAQGAALRWRTRAPRRQASSLSRHAGDATATLASSCVQASLYSHFAGGMSGGPVRARGAAEVRGWSSLMNLELTGQRSLIGLSGLRRSRCGKAGGIYVLQKAPVRAPAAATAGAVLGAPEQCAQTLQTSHPRRWPPGGSPFHTGCAGMTARCDS